MTSCDNIIYINENISLFYTYFQAGTQNPEVSLSVIDLTDPSSKAVSLEAPIDEIGRQVHSDFYY